MNSLEFGEVMKLETAIQRGGEESAALVAESHGGHGLVVGREIGEQAATGENIPYLDNVAT